jgi:hypothetical protein
MATTTFNRAETRSSTASAKSFGRRLLDRYINAQMTRARLRVNAYLQSLDDKALSRLGYTPSDIRNIRRSEASDSLMI